MLVDKILVWVVFSASIWKVTLLACIAERTKGTRQHSEEGGGGVLPYIKGGDACREISNEPLKGTNLGVA